MSTKALQLQINSRAINDTSRSLAGTGIAITPPLDENFWLMRVPLSDKQAIVGFPKFSVTAVGFQVESDWNTNLPSGKHAIEIYNHIKHNKGDAKISRGRCIEAIAMIQAKVLEMKRAEALEKIKACDTDDKRLDVLGDFLRKTGAHMIAEAFNR